MRVAPFFHENLPKMIERFGMEELYVFSTDYPHLEGSRDPIGKFNKWLGAQSAYNLEAHFQMPVLPP